MPVKTITLMSTVEAGKYLTQQLGLKPNWSYWLGDNRKERQQAFKVPYTKQGKLIYYAKADLDHFIAWEKHRRSGVIEAPAMVSSRVAEVTKVLGLSDSSYDPEKGAHWEAGEFTATRAVTEGGKSFIRLTTPRAPLGYFRLTVEQARELAQELLEAAGQMASQPRYETIRDDASIKVMRRID